MPLGLSALVSAAVLFVGTHFILSHPARAPLVAKLGEKGFLALYSLVALITLGGMGHAFAKAPRGPWLFEPMSDWAWIVASVLTIIALVLLVGSFRGNPALPGSEGKAAGKEPAGVFLITRHPMMWGIAIWGAAHILVMPDARTFVFMGAFIVLALAGASLQDKKKEQLDPAWPEWEAKTSFWPRLSGLAGASIVTWFVALVAWLAITFSHMPLGGIPAGVWRWLG